MFLVYTPDGGDEQRFHYEPGRLRVAEMKAIEQATGMSYGTEFKQKLLMGSTVAKQALLWTFLRRRHNPIKLADVDFCDDELVLERDQDEIAAELEALATFEGMPADERLAAEAMLRAQLANAPQAPGKATSSD